MNARISQSKQRTHTAPGSVEKTSPVNPRSRITDIGNSAHTLCMHNAAQKSADARLCIHSRTENTSGCPLCMHNPMFSAKTLPLCMHRAILSANTLSLCTKKHGFWTKTPRFHYRKPTKNT